MKNRNFSPEEIVASMKNKFGDGMPKVVEYLAELSPESLDVQLKSSSDSMMDDNSPFDVKMRTFIYIATALAQNNQGCVKAHFHSALKMGATKEELLAVVKIVRHATSSGVYGNASYILENLMK